MSRAEAVARWLQKYSYKLYELADELVYWFERRRHDQ